MTTRLRLGVALVLWVGTPAAFALDLLQAYEAAQRHDATWLAAQARAAAGQERLPQAEAALRPNVSLTASRALNELSTRSTSSAPPAADRYPSGTYSLALRQPLINLSLRAQRARAQAQTDEASATLRLEQQNLALRVIGSYLEALSAQDEVALVTAQTAFYTRQLEAARKLFASGAGTRTDMDEVQAKLDMARALELETRQLVALALRKLQVLVREPFGMLAPLNPARLLRVAPAEAALDDHIARAEQSSPELLVARAQQAAAAQEVQRLQSGHYPTLDAIAQWSRGDRDNTNAPSYRFANKSIGVQLTVPIYSGGGLSSQVRQAQAELESSTQVLDALRQDLGVRLHKEHRGVIDGLGRISALETAERSAAQVLTATQKSYAGGSRTALDVLNAEQQRAAVVRDLARTRYAVLLSRARLLSLTDQLDTSALSEMNASFGDSN